MIKKIILGLILCCVIFSCGKKGDPVYENGDKSSIHNIKTNKV